MRAGVPAEIGPLMVTVEFSISNRLPGLARTNDLDDELLRGLFHRMSKSARCNWLPSSSKQPRYSPEFPEIDGSSVRMENLFPGIDWI